MVTTISNYDSYTDITADEESVVLRYLRSQCLDTVFHPLDETLSEDFTPFHYKEVFDYMGGLARPAYRSQPDIPVPHIRKVLTYLKKKGYKTIISLSDKQRKGREDVLIRFFWRVKEKDHRFFHFTTEDHVETSDYTSFKPERLEAFNALVKKETEQRRRVAVYCGLGFGRTAFHLAGHISEEKPFYSLEDAEEMLVKKYHLKSVLEIREARLDKILESYLNQKYPSNAIQKMTLDPIEKILKTSRRFMLQSVLIWNMRSVKSAVKVITRVGMLASGAFLTYQGINLFM